MKLKLALAILFASPIPAQSFRVIGCSTDCATVFFLSEAKQPYQQQHSGGKLFRLNDSGLFLEKSFDPNPNALGVTDYFDMQDVGLSANTPRSIVARRICPGATAISCIALLQTRFFNSTGAQIGTARGAATLSPSGTLALARNNAGLGNTLYEILRIEPTPTVIRSFTLIGARAGAILDDASFAICSGDGLLLAWPEESPLKNLSPCQQVQPGFEAGEFYVWQQRPDGKLRLHSVKRQSQTLLLDDLPIATSLTVTRNGMVFGIISNPQDDSRKLLVASLTGQPAPILSRPDVNIDSFIASSDGNIVWYFTTNRALHKWNLSTGDDVIYMPDFPSLTSTTPPIATRGSLLALHGVGLSGAATCTIVTSSATTYRCPFIPSSGPDLAFVQIPWELPPQIGDSIQLKLSEFRPTFFEASLDQPVPIFDLYPAFLGIFHAGFRGVVSTTQPAQPGELMQIYMVGLGPVEGAALTGQPWPIDLALPIKNNEFNCTLSTPSQTNTRPLAVTYAGSAPGLLGLYQVAVQLPTTLDSNPEALLTCGFAKYQARALLPQTQKNLLTLPLQEPVQSNYVRYR